MRKGLKIVIDITEEANADLILKYLYKNMPNGYL